MMYGVKSEPRLRWIAGLLGVLLLAAACDSLPRQAGSTTPAASAPATTGAAAPAGPAACRLPVLLTSAAGSASPGQPAFVQIPGGAVTPVAAAPTSATAYAAPAGRWIAADPDAISPDGSRYAYTEFGLPANDPAHPAATRSRVHVVDIRTGSDRVGVGSGSYAVIGWVPAGLLLVLKGQGGPAGPGVFRADPDTGSVTVVDSAAVSLRWIVAGNAGWFDELDAADPNPVLAGPGSGNAVTRVDAASGVRQRWLTRPGHLVWPIGAAAGGVLVGTEDAGHNAQVLLLTAPETVHEVWSGHVPDYTSDLGVTASLADSSRTWLLGPADAAGGRALYSLEGTSMRSVPTRVGALGGACR
jgi:hypothetical protein